MALNIKDPKVHEMVKQIAAITGQSQAAAVESAVEQKLRELLAVDRAERILALGRDAASRMTPEERAFDYDAELYDEETGLPR